MSSLVGSSGLLVRLARNQAGNTLALAAAAIIPLAGLIGGGLDMGRAYMARTRLQQACDAAALAGRRAMTGASMSDADKTVARQFFNFNFPQNTFGTASFTPVIQSKPGETTTVQVTAATTLPTTIMRLFGKQNVELGVKCESRFDIGNTDVMLVLDTTGSMAQSISDGKGGTTTRMAALRQAVKEFYDTLGPGSEVTGRIRYGFIPYSSTVNVGYQLPKAYLLGGTAGETADYQTRRAVSSGTTSSDSATGWVRVSGTATNGSGQVSGGVFGCPAIPADTVTSNTSSQVTGSTTDANGVVTVTTVVTRVRNGVNYTATNCSWFLGYTQAYTSVSFNNYVDRQTVTTTKTPQTTWQYGYYPQDVSGFVNGAATANPTYRPWASTDANGTSVSATSVWSGCIEERKTVSTITATSSIATVPAGAYDLQIDTIPTNADTKWRPHWPDVEFTRAGRWLNDNVSNDFRGGTGGFNACPSQSRKLASYSNRTSTPAGMASSFNTYIDNLVPIGGTYHDIGMIWGARFLSPTGIFASENSTAPNGFTTSRHIVFMTDGDMSAYGSVYGAYGYQLLDGRVAATSTNDDGLTAIHNRRLEMLCNAAKGKGITIWIIGFRNTSEGPVGSQLQGCASSANHWTMAYDASSLSEKFKTIAKNIGGLRLSQ